MDAKRQKCIISGIDLSSTPFSPSRRRPGSVFRMDTGLRRCGGMGGRYPLGAIHLSPQADREGCGPATPVEVDRRPLGARSGGPSVAIIAERLRRRGEGFAPLKPILRVAEPGCGQGAACGAIWVARISRNASGSLRIAVAAFLTKS